MYAIPGRRVALIPSRYRATLPLKGCALNRTNSHRQRETRASLRRVTGLDLLRGHYRVAAYEGEKGPIQPPDSRKRAKMREVFVVREGSRSSPTDEAGPSISQRQKSTGVSDLFPLPGP